MRQNIYVSLREIGNKLLSKWDNNEFIKSYRDFIARKREEERISPNWSVKNSMSQEIVNNDVYDAREFAL